MIQINGLHPIQQKHHDVIFEWSHKVSQKITWQFFGSYPWLISEYEEASPWINIFNNSIRGMFQKAVYFIDEEFFLFTKRSSFLYRSRCSLWKWKPCRNSWERCQHSPCPDLLERDRKRIHPLFFSDTVKMHKKFMNSPLIWPLKDTFLFHQSVLNFA